MSTPSTHLLEPELTQSKSAEKNIDHQGGHLNYKNWPKNQGLGQTSAKGTNTGPSWAYIAQE